MSNAIYAAIARQQGLKQEMQVVANNIANASTTGYKSNRGIFSEFIVNTGTDTQSLSMGALAANHTEMAPGALRVTGGQFDLAIQGEGFFLLETPQGERLTRAGHFQLGADGRLVDGLGNAVLGAGGNVITFPPEVTNVSIAADGTISADGELFDQIGVVIPEGSLQRDGNTQFTAPDGYLPSPEPGIVQGALEQSNVSPVQEIARLIEVQRAYEAGQALLEREDQRISKVINTLSER